MSNGSWLSNPVLATLLGVAVGAGVNYLISELREQRRRKRTDKKRRNAAYRLLQGVLDELRARYPITSAQLTVDEHRRIIEILADYQDVLYDETVAAWDYSRPNLAVPAMWPTYGMDLGRFADEVRIHYERLRRENPYHQLDEQNEPSAQ